MKRPLFSLIIAVFLWSCATAELDGSFFVGKPWGGPAPYGERVHPGIDYDINHGAPIIAAANGKVIYIVDRDSDGFDVVVMHGKHFKSVYGHLSKVLVINGQLVERGALIGLSGESNNYSKLHYAHLHFGLCKTGPGLDCHNFSASWSGPLGADICQAADLTGCREC